MKLNFPKGIYYKCSKCGLCCGDTSKKERHILLMRTEAEKIAISINKKICEFATEISDKEPYAFEMKKTDEKKTCIFLEDNLCTIYNQRPLICRFYPIQLLTAENGTYNFSVTNECKGISKKETAEKRKLDKRFFKKLLGQASHEFQRSS